jgi:hypothetical protein
VGASLRYNSATDGSSPAVPATRIKSFATLDLRLGVRDSADRWEVMLWGTLRTLITGILLISIVIASVE